VIVSHRALSVFSFAVSLRFFDRVYGASVFASAAIYAFVVDHVDTFIAKRNRAYGTSIRARTASNAFVVDDMCHIPFYLRFFVYVYIIPYIF
jgi:hypothetical protein